MRNLKFISTGSKFSTIPETAGRLHRHNVNCAGYQAYDPACNVVDTFKGHIVVGYIPIPFGRANIISLLFAVVSLQLFIIFLMSASLRCYSIQDKYRTIVCPFVTTL